MLINEQDGSHWDQGLHSCHSVTAPATTIDGWHDIELQGRVWFERWQKGLTGFPMIDSCMRALKQTGWINFRMRAIQNKSKREIYNFLTVEVSAYLP